MDKYKLIIKTLGFADKFAQFEIEDQTRKDFKKVSDGFYEIEFEKSEEKQMFDFVYNLVYFSRVIENIYLKIDEFKKIDEINKNNLKKKLSFITKKLYFEVDATKSFEFDHQDSEKQIGKLILESNSNLKVDLNNFDISFKLLSYNKNNYIIIDLVGFNLTKRDYKVNNGHLTLNSIIPNFCFYLIGLDEEEKNYSLLDPISSLGDITIEAASFNPRLALNQKKKHQVLIKKLFNFIPPIPKESNKQKLKILSVVQNNKVFKNQRENMNYSGLNYKLSQYEIDWLDVKFKEAQIDYIVTQIPEFVDEKEKDKFLGEFFYQLEFIFNVAAIISKSKIDKKYFTKNELDILEEKKITITKQDYYIYVIG